MRLSDLMGSLELSTCPQIALVIFLGVFAAVCLRLFRASTRQACDEARMLPLQDADTTTPKDAAP